MRSSYIPANYGYVFQTFVLLMKPKLVVEVGVLDGYSAFNIASAIKELKEVFNLDVKFDCYDLWNNYEYKHGNREAVEKYFQEADLLSYVNFFEGDAFRVYMNYEDESIDLLHFDISNDGEKLERMMNTWHSKIRRGGVILFEGGSVDRDQIEWMKKYKKKPIKSVLFSNKIIEEHYKVFVYQKFPSLTVFFKNE